MFKCEYFEAMSIICYLDSRRVTIFSNLFGIVELRVWYFCDL